VRRGLRSRGRVCMCLCVGRATAPWQAQARAHAPWHPSQTNQQGARRSTTTMRWRSGSCARRATSRAARVQPRPGQLQVRGCVAVWRGAGGLCRCSCEFFFFMLSP
jgi:hypothetical protein